MLPSRRMGKDFRFKLLAPSESQIETAILGYLVEFKRLLAFPVRNAGYYDTKLKRFRTQQSKYFRKGVPDIILIYRGRFVGLEVKSEKGVQSRDQKVFAQDILKSEGLYYVVRSVEQVQEILNILETKFPAQ